MSIVVVGLNHKTAPLEIREKISFPEAAKSLKELIQVNHVDEGLILSTCNRVEICVSTQSEQDLTAELEHFLCESHGVASNQLREHIYKMDGRDAIHHTFRVASSLDSLVLGEPQIFGQVKDAYFQAKEANTLGPVLHRFYHKAFSVAKRVRRETGVGKEKISVGSVAIDLSEKIFDRLDNKVVLLMGAGEMIETAAQRLLEKGVTQFYFTNRTHENVIKLTSRLKSNPETAEKSEVHFRFIPLSKCSAYLDKVDMMVVSTSSPSYLVTVPMIKSAMKKRKQRPIFCIDISVPRNVDPEIQNLDNVYLYDVDDLEIIVKGNIKKRKLEAEAAETIVEAEAESFYQWLSALKFTPTLKSIREKIEAVRREELSELFSFLPEITDEERMRIEKYSKRFSNKILHDPFVSIREEVKVNNVRFVEFLRKLFRLS